ncbi:MAG: hypothetical protein ACKVRP_09795 [Bacteroidota bacterium]
MSTGNARHLPTPRRQRQTPKPLRKRMVAGKPAPDKPEQNILALVRTGVERFILKNATIEDFFLTLQTVTAKEKTYSHQLTKSVFSGIVREAIRKRDLKAAKVKAV